MMTRFIRAERSSVEDILTPSNGTHWSLEEMQTLVGGYIELVPTVDGRWMVIDEEGHLKGKTINVAATLLYKNGARHPIVGDVLLVDDIEEIDGPEDRRTE